MPTPSKKYARLRLVWSRLGYHFEVWQGSEFMWMSEVYQTELQRDAAALNFKGLSRWEALNHRHKWRFHPHTIDKLP